MPVTPELQEGKRSRTRGVPPVAALPLPGDAATRAEADLEFLRRGRWFGSLPPALQALIVERSTERSYKKGMHLLREGATPRGLFVVLQGRVHAVRGIGDGNEALIHVGEPGFWFGEHGLLSGRPVIATVVAMTTVRARLLSVSEFNRIVREAPSYYPYFVALLLERYETVFRYASEARALAAEEWLWTRLRDLADIRRREARLQGPVEIAVSQTELAGMVGVSRQTLCMLLGRLQESGRIDIGYRKIRVL